MRRVFVVLILLSVINFVALASDYKRDGNSVILTLKPDGNTSARQLCLQFVSDRIVRVRATPEDTFPNKQSLVVLPQALSNNVAFTVSEHSGSLRLSTYSLSVSVDMTTGRLTFCDAQGKPLLEESDAAGKTFRRYEVPARDIGIGTLPPGQNTGWSWRALFNSPADEAFYGLGQHQSEELNMKGRNEELYQYNTKVSIPFVISNKNYGILWDSYSLCRFGNPDDYQQLNRLFTLYDKNGRQGSLTGTYTDKKGVTIERAEDSLYFEHAFVIPNLPANFNLNGSRVVYEGWLEPSVSSNFHFMLYYAGYIRLFLDGKEIVGERWRTAWNPSTWKFTFPMSKGRRVPLRIEWQPDGGTSYCGLRAATPATQEEQSKLSIWSEMSRDMDYYFIAGDNMDDVISGYRTLTGKAQVMPRWALGFWQSRERYKTADELLSTVSEFRKRKVPMDNIVQDWNYWPIDSWGDHEFDAKRYPEPKAMIDSVHAMNARFMISVWPKFYCSTDNYKELDSKGFMYRQAVADSIYDWLGYMGSFYDAYSPEARRIFWRQIDEKLYTGLAGGTAVRSRSGSDMPSALLSSSDCDNPLQSSLVDAWWMDASEPNVRDCTPMWYRKALCGPTSLGSSTEYFNAYSIVNADAIYNGQRSVNPNQRVFLLTRSGFAGEQRYSTATWSGDIATRWEDMRAQMTAGMNFSLSGIPFWGMDNGGFCVENRYVAAQKTFNKTGEETEDLREWRELQTRWNQFGCFVPLYRAHGQWPPREVWNIAPDGHPAYESIVYYHRLRYRLMPYLYSMAGWVHLNDYTLMRALVMDYGSDSSVLDIKDQWMFGPSLMACPVARYQERSRGVYLPRQCGWYALYDGKHHAGGQTITADAPYTRIPVFVPEGAIIPFGPDIQWSDEKSAELINLYVYAGKDGTFSFYEDENTNYNYEKGHYAVIDIAYDEASRTLTIGDRKGGFDGMLAERRFNIVLVTKDKPKSLNLDNPVGRLVRYVGRKLVVRLAE